MGGLFGGKTTTTSTSKTDTGPSSFQRPYLDTAFNAAQSDFNSKQGTPYYQGETYAGMSDDQKSILDRIKTYASGQGMTSANAVSQFGMNALSGSADKASAAIDNYATLAGQDGTAANIAAAQKYANDPNIQGVIDGATRDVTRNFNEQTIPGIDRAASAGGNINSSRAGVAAGIAQRGAADRVADISSSVRSDAYNRGLTLAQADRAAQLDAASRTAGLYNDQVNQGIGAISSGADIAHSYNTDALSAGAAEQADRQGALDAAFKKWQGEDTRSSDLLSRYMNIVGGNQWGQSGTSSGTGTSKESGNILGKALGAASTIASFI